MLGLFRPGFGDERQERIAFVHAVSAHLSERLRNIGKKHRNNYFASHDYSREQLVSPPLTLKSEQPEAKAGFPPRDNIRYLSEEIPRVRNVRFTKVRRR